MQFISDLIDIKVTIFYALLITFFNNIGIDDFYKYLCGFIFVGYNLHRWYIMFQKHEMDKKEFKNKKK